MEGILLFDAKKDMPVMLAAILVIAFLAATAVLLSAMAQGAENHWQEPDFSGSPYVNERIPECEEGSVTGCEVAGCAGTVKCENGALTECRLGRKICIPGQIVGCNLDSCRFGTRACNDCGTGFGECEPKPDGASATACSNNCS